MTLYEVIKNIERIGGIAHVNSSYIGDIYELNKQQNIQYPAMVITQGTHYNNTEDEVDEYNLNIFLVDRLTEDKSNELDVQDWAYNGLSEIVNTIENTAIGYQSSSSAINTFTERFNSLCAGAFINLTITVPQSSCQESRIVTSVNGKIGDVKLDLPDMGKYYTKDEVEVRLDEKQNVLNLYKEPDVLHWVLGDDNARIHNDPYLGKVIIDANQIELNAAEEIHITAPFEFTINGKEIADQTDIELLEAHIARELATKVDNDTFNETVENLDRAIDELDNEKADKTQLTNYYTKTESDNKYLTEHQPIKTINGISIIGTGNVDIEGGVTIEKFESLEETVAQALTRLNDFGNNIESALTTNYYTKVESDNKYLDSESLINYYTKEESDNKYTTIEDLNNYYTKDESDNKYLIVSSLDNYYTKDESDNKYLNSESLINYYDKDYLDERLEVIAKALNDLNDRLSQLEQNNS